MRTDLFDFDLPAERIALRPVSPRALEAYHWNLIWLSLASLPELAKNTLPTGKGAISLSFPARAMPGSWLLPPKIWPYDSLRICSAAVSASSFSPQPRAVDHRPDIASR